MRVLLRSLGIVVLGLSSALAETPSPGQAPAKQGGPAATATGEAPHGPACDSGCVRSNADRAVQPCAQRVEAEAPADYDWILRPYGSIFQEADAPEVPTSSVVRYRGDSIRFLNPQREWSRIVYECTWDAAAAKVIAVKVRIGILGKPNAVATAPMSGARPQEAARPAAAIAPAPSAAPAVGATANKLKIGEPTMTEVRQVTPKPGTVR